MSRASLNRRPFMGRSLAAAGVGASFAIGGTKSSGRIIGANDTVRIAVAGLNGRGEFPRGRVRRDARRRDRLPGRSRLADLCQAAQAGRVGLEQGRQAGGHAPATEKDIRRVLEDKSVDAVSVATPNHWHALMTIWACQAGKDVYVEKPCSHNVHEGRVAVEAARQVQPDRPARHAEPLRPQVGRGRRGHPVGQARQAAGLAGPLLQAPREHRREADHHAARQRSTSTSGSARRPSSRSTPTWSITTGTGSGISATATSATRASTRWTSPDG